MMRGLESRENGDWNSVVYHRTVHLEAAQPVSVTIFAGLDRHRTAGWLLEMGVADGNVEACYVVRGGPTSHRS